MNELKVKVGGDTSGFELSMSKVRGAARSMAKDISSGIAGRIGGLFAMGAIENTIRKTAAYAGQLTDMSARTGVAVEALQRLDRAALENGTSLDSLVGLWERVGSAREDAIGNSKGGAAKAFGAFGIGRSALQTSSPDEIVRKIADAFQKSSNVEKLISPLRDIGGRGAGQMIALFRAGLDQQYQDMQVMTGAQADLLDELDDKYSTLQNRISVGVTPALVALIDAFTWVQDKLTSFFTALMVESDAIDKGMSSGDVTKAGEAAYKQSEAENKAERDAQEKSRKERVANRLRGGKLDFKDIVDAATKSKPTKATEEKKQEAARMTEIQLDSLSKAGLFAGGAVGGFSNNYPQRQLATTEKLLNEAKRTNDLLEDKI
jgi:hypothetical protein